MKDIFSIGEIDIDIAEISVVFETESKTPWHFRRTSFAEGYWYDLNYMSEGIYLKQFSSESAEITPGTLSLSRILIGAHNSSVALPTKNYTIRFRTNHKIHMAEDSHLGINIHVENPSKTESYFIKALELNAGKSPTNKLELRIIIYKLLIIILENYSSKENESHIPELMIKATDYIRNKMWNEDISVKQIAEHLYITPEYFIRLFKKTFGITPRQYINRLKLEKASQFLRTTNRKITEIAENSGFYDMHHFTRSFRKNFGLSPGEYRKKYSDENNLF